MVSNSDGSAAVSILCCMCGVPMEANSVNTCASCLAGSADITKGIATQVTLHQCRGCQRWHKAAGKWIACDLESRELMGLCLQHVNGLGKKVRLTDAVWIWTEPHSMRLKVKLTVQSELQKGTVLQQSFAVEFIVRNQQCIECQAEFRQGSWKSLVQVRQRVSHKRTFLYLEQLILKHDAHRGCLNIKVFRDGMDFYFPDRSKAARFICFLENVVPIRVKTSKKLIGTDDKSNVSNYKYTNFVEICPLCKDDLLYLPVKLARNLGSISRLVLVKNISNLIHLIDPATGQTASFDAEVYWRNAEFLRPLITAGRSRLKRMVVLAKQAVRVAPNAAQKLQRRNQSRRLATVTMVPEEQMGITEPLEEQSHIGYLLKAGDICLGYDLRDTQHTEDDDQLSMDVVLVRKLYGANGGDAQKQQQKKRCWTLRRLAVEEEEDRVQKRRDDDMMMDDEEDFLREVEADKDMRVNINLYKATNASIHNDEVMNDADEDDQKITLDELLDGLKLEAGPDPEDAEHLLGEGEKAARDGLRYIQRDDARFVREKEAAVAVGQFSEKFNTKQQE